MLKAHVDTFEELLLATSKIPANSGHPLHKGTPREAFIQEFLQGHLSERVAVGRRNHRREFKSPENNGIKLTS